MLKIIITWISHALGGAEKSCFELAQELCSQGHIVQLLIFVKDPTMLHKVSSEFSRQPFFKLFLYHTENDYINILTKSISGFPYNIDVLFSSRRTNALDQIFCKRFNIPIVVIAREILQEGAHIKNVTNYQSANYVIAISESVRSRLISLGVNKDRIFTVLNGINLVDSRKYPHDIYPEVFTFAYIGRLVYWKRVEHFIHSAKLVQETAKKQVKFIIIGDGIEKNNLKKLAIDLNIDVDFIEWVSPIWTCSCFYHVSVLTSFEEAFGRIVVESLAMKRPVIVSNCGGSKEMIDDQLDGLIYNSGNIDDLAEKMLSLIDDQDFYQSLSLNTQKKAENFDIHKTTKRITEIIEGVLK